MTKRMLIDATHKEETRVVTISDGKIYDYDSETSTKKQLKGNIYLAKVARVEPSLQAVFVEYGGNRHGFLPFSEIHPDYYRIPVEDLKENPDVIETEDLNKEDSTPVSSSDEGSEDIFDEVPKRRARPMDKYKIQEVIQKRQILLVQIVKEERGNKGAALTTFLSIPGRYCVLMPNTPNSGGISRKISHPKSRSKLKKIIDSLTLPDGVSIIIRTAGMERTKTEIKRDFEYLMRLWSKIRQLTLDSMAPCLIYQEDDLIKRSIRDIYTRDIIEILIEGEEAYKSAKNLMKLLIPSHSKRVQKYKDDTLPLYQKFDVEHKLEEIYQPDVQLKSGGTIVINPTEALVSVDVNSARSTRQRHIDDTALTTNLEAAEEVARQLRLRDLGGLVVIDFIDMQEEKHNHMVEKKLRDSLRGDRARIQVGKISGFGLLEMSRQRLRPSLLEVSSKTCPMCKGIGLIRSTESSSLSILRYIESEALKNKGKKIVVSAAPEAAEYILNQKRDYIHMLEEKHDVMFFIRADKEYDLEHYTVSFIDKNATPTPLAKKSHDNQKQPKHTQKSSADNSNKKNKNSTKQRRQKNNNMPQNKQKRDDAPQKNKLADTNEQNNVNTAKQPDGNVTSSEEKENKQRSNKRRRSTQNRRRKMHNKNQNQVNNNNEAVETNESNNDKQTENAKVEKKEKPKAKVKNTAAATDNKKAQKSTKQESITKKKATQKPKAAETKTDSDGVVHIKEAANDIKSQPKKKASKKTANEGASKKKQGWWQRLLDS